MTYKKDEVKLSSIAKGKVNLYRDEDSYAMLTYVDEKDKAIVLWNSTNREAPTVIQVEDKAYIKDNTLTSAHIPEHKPNVNEYIFIFLTYDIYREERKIECEKYWRLPFVKKMYKSFEDLLVTSSLGMKTEHLYVFKVTEGWLNDRV